jgi:ABC-type uncharacterized transport system auxiliary subunit
VTISLELRVVCVVAKLLPCALADHYVAARPAWRSRVLAACLSLAACMHPKPPQAYYLRTKANMNFAWQNTGGFQVRAPSSTSFPTLDAPITVRRSRADVVRQSALASLPLL